MQIDWTALAFFVMGFFLLSGFSRGWWKEAVTTGLLAILVLLLQNPDLAQRLINLINSVVATVWRIIPSSITSVFNDVVFGIESNVAPQLDPASSGTWLMILALIVTVSIFFSRTGFHHEPVFLGKVLGAVLGAFNGFLVLSLAREYLDGRALPGAPVATTSATPAGASAAAGSTADITVVTADNFVPAASEMVLEITRMPSQTILDSIIPWLIIGGGLLFLFAVVRTRVEVASSPNGRKLKTAVPPFYRGPAAASATQPNPPVTPVQIVDDLT